MSARVPSSRSAPAATSARPGLVIAAEFRGPDEARARSEVVQRVASECGVVPADVVFLAPGLAAPDVVGQAAPSGSQAKSGGGAGYDGSSSHRRRRTTATCSTEVFDDRVTEWTAEAEATERFPRKLIEHLGAAGVFAAASGAGGPAAPRRGQAHRAGLPARPARFGRHRRRRQPARLGDRDPAPVRQVRLPQGRSCEQAIRGEAVLCIGASEESGGSDLQIVETEVRSVGDGFDVRGHQEVRVAVPHRRSHHRRGPQRRPRSDQQARQRARDRRAHHRRSRSRRRTARSAPARWTPRPCTSTPGCRPTLWSPAPGPGWPRSRGDSRTNGCRSPVRWRRPASACSVSPTRA